MADPFIGEIRPVGFNYAPAGWALCNGQTLQISQNTALFAVIGTLYGGNGTTNFMLPNLQSRVPVGMGQGVGLSTYIPGQTGGSESVTLTVPQLAAHTHTVLASANPLSQTSPAGNYLPTTPTRTTPLLYATGPATVAMGQGMIANTGNSQGHPNIQPYLAINFIIALNGIYPSRP